MVKANKNTIKFLNRQNILNAFIGKDEITKNEVIKKTGLSAAAVSYLVAELIAEGMLVEKTFAQSSGGRKPMLYSLNDARYYVLTLKVTPKGIIIGIVNLKCEIVYSKTIIVSIRGIHSFEDFLSKVINMLRQEQDEVVKNISYVAVSTPGIIDYKTGELIYSSTLVIENLNISQLIQTLLGRPIKVYLFKDSDAMVLGEFYFTYHDSIKNIAYILCENGVGFSLIVQGRLFTQDGSGLELGRVSIDMNRPFGAYEMGGCIGELISEQPAVRRYNELCEKATRQQRIVDTTSLDYDDIINMYEEKDPIAVKVIREQIATLSVVAVNVVNLFNPDLIIIGGPLTRIGEYLETKMEEQVKNKSLKPFTRTLSVKSAKLGVNSALLGMANYVFKKEFFRLINI